MIYAVTYRYTDDVAARDAVRAEHRDHLRSLAEQGALLVSGPFGPGEPAGALLLFRADARDDVDRWVAADPFTARGIVASASTTEWEPVLGSLLNAFRDDAF
jgi:uncharacterized protein YciI